MGLTTLDILVLLIVGGGAVLGLMRGFVTEVLSLFAWVAIVFVLKLFHTPLAAMLAPVVGTVGGAAVLAFVLITGVTWFGRSEEHTSELQSLMRISYAVFC